MESSDDDMEASPEFVSDYYFVNDDQEPVPFTVLPVKWNDNDSIATTSKPVFLYGYVDGGLQRFYKQVKAWKFDLTGGVSEILILLKDNNWIKLQKPKKSYDPCIRSILITVQYLHVLRKTMGISEKALWDQLARDFSLYDVRPSVNDLVDHTELIQEAVKKDEYLAKSKVLMSFLEKKPIKKAIYEEVLTGKDSSFIVEDAEEDFVGDNDEAKDSTGDDTHKDEGDDVEGDDDEKDEDDFAVCALCDDGGGLISCDGVCMRSFHARPMSTGAEEAGCATLGLSKGEAEAPIFLCKNCLYKRHQCYACGELGSSDETSGAEVFLCANATCEHFYHPRCVAKLLHGENEAVAEQLQKEIAAGEFFICPVHRCFVCKELENKEDPELQFAVCRRCPKAYHKKCLPRKICFETDEDQGIIQRAWTGLLHQRILIYCLKHRIDPYLKTPSRDHIKFPEVPEREVNQAAPLYSRVGAKLLQTPVAASRDDQNSSKSGEDVERPLKGDGSSLRPKLGKLKGADLHRKIVTEKRPPPAKVVKSTDVEGRRISGMNLPSKSTTEKRRPLKKVEKVTDVEGTKTSLGKQYRAFNSQQTDSVKSPKGVREVDLDKNVDSAIDDLTPLLDSSSERRILNLWKEATSAFTLKRTYKKYNEMTSTRGQTMKQGIEKITKGKVEGYVGAVQTALKRLDDGRSIDEARAVCEPDVLRQIVKWKGKLRVYMAPFLYSNRYTSFGRHFTKVDKLKEIVNKIHWYVQGGDTIVDFCCGANDFSTLMHKKLEQTGKKCNYRNFDLFPTKNDFCFEKRDWMAVQPNDLPEGSQLIMGLNPPFGVKASLANQFINKALEFKPKLIVLIVPTETERLDKKQPPYDLVWEDDKSLSGKSFYLPGSVDVNNRQMDDWNVVTPVLYLWSRRDWTSKHKQIAEMHRHLSSCGKQTELESHPEIQAPGHFEKRQVADAGVSLKKGVEETHPEGRLTLQQKVTAEKHGQPSPCGKQKEIDSRKVHPKKSHAENLKVPVRNRVFDSVQVKELEERKDIKEAGPQDREGSSSKNDDGEKHKNSGGGKNVGRGSKKRRHAADMHHRRMDNISPQHKFKRGRPSNELSHGRPDAGSPSDQHLIRDTTRDREVRGDGYGRFSPRVPSPTPMQYGVGDASRNVDDIVRKYASLDNEVPYGRPMHVSPGPEYGTRNVDAWPRTSGEMDCFAARSRGSELSYRPPSFLGEPAYSRIGMSAMDRYAPRLDELNHNRIGSMRPEYLGPGRSGMYDPHRPHPMYDHPHPHPLPLPPRPGYGSGSPGLAPDSQYPYPHNNTGGWIFD